MNSARHFDAPWGTPLKLVTGLTTGILVYLTIVGLTNGKMSTMARLAAVMLPPLGIAAGACFVVRGYELADDALWVERLGWRTRISLGGLKSATVDPKAMRGSLRTCGNGGFFSFTGWYWNKALRSYRLFGTDLKKAVVLDLGTRRVVVTPDEPETFARKVREVAGLC